MRVRVLFFGALKDIAGRTEDALEIPPAPRSRTFLPSIRSASKPWGRGARRLYLPGIRSSLEGGHGARRQR